MEPHQERVVAEKQELDTKIDKLITFMKAGFYQTLPTAEQELLYRQLGVMKDYSMVLNDRIDLF